MRVRVREREVSGWRGGEGETRGGEWVAVTRVTESSAKWSDAGCSNLIQLNQS